MMLDRKLSLLEAKVNGLLSVTTELQLEKLSLEENNMLLTTKCEELQAVISKLEDERFFALQKLEDLLQKL